jgi:hypothetical protein
MTAHNRETNQGMNWIRKDKRLAIHMRDHGRCVYCESQQNLTLDHLTPISKSYYMCRCGSGETLGNCCINNERNLVTACLACNSERGAKNWRVYAELHVGAVGRIQRQRVRSIRQLRPYARVALELSDNNVKSALKSA